MFDQVSLLFHIIFTCYSILVLYYLLCLEGLMCFVQVFQDRGIWFQVHHRWRFRCEWVFSSFPNSRLSLESIIGCFCHGIARGGDCKVVIYNYVLCWLYYMIKSFVIAINYFLVFCGIVLGLVLSWWRIKHAIKISAVSRLSHEKLASKGTHKKATWEAHAGN